MAEELEMAVDGRLAHVILRAEVQEEGGGGIAGRRAALNQV